MIFAFNLIATYQLNPQNKGPRHKPVQRKSEECDMYSEYPWFEVYSVFGLKI